jgi:hypothetical protein
LRPFCAEKIGFSAPYNQRCPWYSSGRRDLIDLNLRAGGNFDFTPFVYTDTDLSRFSVSFRLSDHFPLRVEFGL